MYLVTRIRTDVLQCQFLFERLKVSRGFATGQELLDVAQEMMAVVLSFWLNRDLLSKYTFAFEWLVCFTSPMTHA
jgi:hypothetical protein